MLKCLQNHRIKYNLSANSNLTTYTMFITIKKKKNRIGTYLKFNIDWNLYKFKDVYILRCN